MRRLALLFVLASAAFAEPARATLRVYARDRALAVRAPSAHATLEVVPRGSATATLRVQPDERGWWRLDALPLAGGAALLCAGATLVELVPAGGEAPPEPPALIEAGDATIEVPVPELASAEPWNCALTLASDSASIRQDFEGADIVVSGEAPLARAVFLGHVAPDQAGPNAATLRAAGATRTWPARVYAWRWSAERTRVVRGEPARFRLEIQGLPDGAECDLVLTASNGLTLSQAPGTFQPEGPGRWTARVRAGTFVFEAPADGDAVVTADLAPACESGR
ncbi:MAG: hypothetical protein IT452_14045 [Planctomycetia bacterium]|nr:hypothetical protein [Planctomycetia bacterium]